MEALGQFRNYSLTGRDEILDHKPFDPGEAQVPHLLRAKQPKQEAEFLTFLTCLSSFKTKSSNMFAD